MKIAARVRPLAFALLGTMLVAAKALSEEAPVARTYGTSSEILLQLPAVSFVPASGANGSVVDGYYVAGVGTFYSAVHLPNGALITGCVLYTREGPNTISSYLTELSGGNGVSASSSRTACQISTSFGDGSEVHYAAIDPPWTVNNGSQYFVTAGLDCNFPAAKCTAYKSVDIRYRLQMSPAPTTATFADVPIGYTYFRAIEALAGAGITSGCGNGNFCPEKSVTRGEMAKFLAVGLGLHWPE